MNPLSGLIAPMLAVLPVAVAPAPAFDPETENVAAPMAGLTPEVEAGPLARDVEYGTFSDMARAQREAEKAGQVRIEQRLIIRISPGPGPAQPLRDLRRNLFAGLPDRSSPRFEERKINQCLPVSGIAGVRPDGPSKLMLFMRDQRIVSATLEKSCSARDYYSGFLVERSTDGMVCAGRDKLLSRSGSNCSFGKLRQLIELADDDD